MTFTASVTSSLSNASVFRHQRINMRKTSYTFTLDNYDPLSKGPFVVTGVEGGRKMIKT